MHLSSFVQLTWRCHTGLTKIRDVLLIPVPLEDSRIVLHLPDSVTSIRTGSTRQYDFPFYYKRTRSQSHEKGEGVDFAQALKYSHITKIHLTKNTVQWHPSLQTTNWKKPQWFVFHECIFVKIFNLIYVTSVVTRLIHKYLILQSLEACKRCKKNSAKEPSEESLSIETLHFTS